MRSQAIFLLTCSRCGLDLEAEAQDDAENHTDAVRMTLRIKPCPTCFAKDNEPLALLGRLTLALQMQAEAKK